MIMPPKITRSTNVINFKKHIPTIMTSCQPMRHYGCNEISAVVIKKKVEEETTASRLSLVTIKFWSSYVNNAHPVLVGYVAIPIEWTTRMYLAFIGSSIEEYGGILLEEDDYSAGYFQGHETEPNEAFLKMNNIDLLFS